MRLSYTSARRMGIGLLLGMILLVATVSILSLHGAASQLHANIYEQSFKAQAFSELALLFSQARGDFHKQRHGEQFTLSGLIDRLDAIRSGLAKLRQVPLTRLEHQGLRVLITEEKRFRTAVYAYQMSIYEDTSQDYSASTLRAIDDVIATAVD